MNIRSYTFVAFLLVSLVCYYVVPKKRQWLCLLAANAVFYACSGPVNLIFILTTALSTFGGALLVARMNDGLKLRKKELSKEEFKAEKERVKARKRLMLGGVLLVNVGILAYLKYWGTIWSFLAHVPNRGGLLLPLGISFYTFQTLAYFMDVYNGKYACERSLPRYLLFVSFFPQLIMGPINRYDALGAQLKREHRFDFENVKRGVLLILFGAMKKYAVADMLVERVSSLLDHPYTNLPGSMIALGVLLYSVYQYMDFSGGIDMVLGVAKLFDLDMQPNFRQPYFATSLADFWRRWHISLGLWMKDYVFYPFALTKGMQNMGKWCGSHLGKHIARTLPAGMANIVVFLLVGIWHGPELHFVVWGLYNGLVIALSDLLRPVFERLNALLHINARSRAWHVFQIVRTFVIVNIGAYFDRIYDVPKSFLYLKNTFVRFGGFSAFFSKSYMKAVFGSLRDAESQVVLVLIGTLIVFVTSVIRERGIDLYTVIQRRNIAVRWATYYVPLILVILAMSFAPGNPVFMYAQY